MSVCPGLSDAVEDSTTGVLSLHRETKFIIGFDFRCDSFSSPASSCVLFDISSRQLVELKWLMFNKHKDDSIHHVWNFPWSVCLRVGCWCQCIWFGFWCPNWFDRITNQEQLCGFWNHVSSWDVPYIIIFDHCFVVFIHLQQNFLMRRVDVWGNKINIIQIIDHSLRLFSVFELCEELNELHVCS